MNHRDADQYFASRRVSVATGLALRVLEAGPPDGDPVMLVHGLASNARLWDGVAVALAEGGHRVAAVDLRGHGQSDKPDDGYDLASVAADVAALVDTLGMDRPLVAGQSWGGNVVVELAAAHPGAVSAIACVDGGTIHLADRFTNFDDCWAALAPPQFEGTTRADIEGYLRRTHPDWPETGIAGALACFEDTPEGTVRPFLTRERHRAIVAGLWDHAPRDRFGAITAPVLFVPAETPGADVGFAEAKRRAIEEAVALIARAEARWFNPADHDVHAQFPGEVAALLATFARAARPR